MNRWIIRVLGVAVAAAVMGLGSVGPAWAAPAAEKATTVDHRFGFVIIAPDDICGPYPGVVTFSVRSQMLHSTERPDGTFNVQYTQTGTYVVDFDDPSRPDQESQYTEAIHHVLTPGRTEVFNEAFHDFPDGVKIWERIHVTIVDGRLLVERVLHKDVGCP